jgi:hypothetical protein
MTYDIKRQQFGQYIKRAYENHYTELDKKRFAAFTDIVDRIPVEALREQLGIKLEKRDDNLWTIHIPTGVLEGTLSSSFSFGIKGKACDSFAGDTFNHSFSLKRYSLAMTHYAYNKKSI